MTTSARLWELADLRLAIDASLESSEGELTPEIEAALDAFAVAFPEKVQGVVCYIKDLKADAKKMNDAAEGFQARATTFLNRAKSLTAYLQTNLERAGITEEVGGPQGSAKLVNNPPSVKELVPTTDDDFRDLFMAAPPFVRRVPEVYSWDKDAIKAAFKNGTLPEEIQCRVTVVQTKGIRLK